MSVPNPNPNPDPTHLIFVADIAAKLGITQAKLRQLRTASARKPGTRLEWIGQPHARACEGTGAVWLAEDLHERASATPECPWARKMVEALSTTETTNNPTNEGDAR